MKLQLSRPIAFIDLETTGVNISVDRIVELAIVKVMPDGSRQVKRKADQPVDAHPCQRQCHTWHHR